MNEGLNELSKFHHLNILQSKVDIFKKIFFILVKFWMNKNK